MYRILNSSCFAGSSPNSHVLSFNLYFLPSDSSLPCWLNRLFGLRAACLQAGGTLTKVSMDTTM